MGAARLAGDVRLFEPEPRFVCAGCGNAEPMSDAISQVARRNLPTSSGRNFPKAATAPALGKNWSLHRCYTETFEPAGIGDRSENFRKMHRAEKRS